MRKRRDSRWAAENKPIHICEREVVLAPAGPAAFRWDHAEGRARGRCLIPILFEPF
jgi:hypothetical protein